MLFIEATDMYGTKRMSAARQSSMATVGNVKKCILRGDLDGGSPFFPTVESFTYCITLWDYLKHSLRDPLGNEIVRLL